MNPSSTRGRCTSAGADDRGPERGGRRERLGNDLDRHAELPYAVRTLRGEIRLTSEPGRGTRLELVFRRARDRALCASLFLRQICRFYLDGGV